MKVGVTLPQFRGAAEDALAAADAAEADPNIDGVFVFDHLWAIGEPDRPSLSAWPLLGALAARTERVVLGPLVARVSLLPPAVLAHHVDTMLRILGADRFIAGLGAGDRLSEPENVAYGVPFPPLDERLAALEDDALRCRALGATVWIGGRSPKVTAVARRIGAALNVWGVPPRRVAEEAERGEVTWGGVLKDHVDGSTDTATLLTRLKDAGATWAVIAPPYRPGQPPGEAIKTISDARERT